MTEQMQSNGTARPWWRRGYTIILAIGTITAGVATFSGGIATIKESFYKIFPPASQITLTVKDVRRYQEGSTPGVSVTASGVSFEMVFFADKSGGPALKYCNGELMLRDFTVVPGSLNTEWSFIAGEMRGEGRIPFVVDRSIYTPKAKFRVACEFGGFITDWQDVELWDLNKL